MSPDAPSTALPGLDEALLTELSSAAPGATVQTRSIDRLAMAHDGSHYLLVPQAVVTPESAADVAALLPVAAEAGVPVTFRSGGTSLSGQASGGGLLVDIRRNFRQIEVLQDGASVRAGCGATIRQINTRLARHSRALGPDPASEIACTLGGVVANNSSGMACGTTGNSYRTIESMTLVLPSGTIINTADDDAGTLLAEREPTLHEGLVRLQQRITGNPAFAAEVARQFSMKNTMGYSLNAFTDFSTPLDILTHLIVGSEGTLGFVPEVVMRTVEVQPLAASCLAVFPSIVDATDALPALIDSGARTLELLDAAALRVAQQLPEADALLKELDVVEHTALLVEYRAGTEAELTELAREGAELLATLPLAAPAVLTTDPAQRAKLWIIRKGLYTAVAGARASGTTALLEDIVVPMPKLTDTVRQLVSLLEQFGYSEAVIFGHAKDANLHFMITPRLDDPAELDRYERFTEDLVDLVLEHGGSLKAEHGTGRIMAPYVRRQFGDELYGIMQEIKGLFDPAGVLNPGVLLEDDPRGHMRHLKLAPTVDPEVDRCVECGYCETVCPSRNLTTTPRQRIVLRREMAVASPALKAELERDYEYEAIDTCAADGLCAVSCPVNIDTGSLMKRLRSEKMPAAGQKLGKAAAKHWGGIAAGARAGLGVAAALPTPLVTGASRIGRALLGDDVVPLAGADLPGPGKPIQKLAPAQPPGNRVQAAGVLFASCISGIFGETTQSSGGAGVVPALMKLAALAETPLRLASGAGSLCCGTPWQSKGLVDGYREMANRTVASLWEDTLEGTLPVVVDASSCTHGLHGLAPVLTPENARRFAQLRIVDAVTFARGQILPGLPPPTTGAGRVVVHPTCSSTHLGVTGDMVALAESVAESVVVPDDWGCCGFAGDRGMLHPELTASATAPEAREVQALDGDAFVSCNRTCELGMSRATGEDYRHVLELVASAYA